MTQLSDKELEEYEKMNSDESKKPQENSLKDSMSWIMISLLSVMQIVMSCLSKVDGDVQFVFPTTAWGWILLIAPKICISGLGYMIWNTFFDKGKDSGMKTDQYKRAQKILLEIQGKSNINEIQVINPVIWERKVKISKGIKMVIMLFLTAFLVAELVVQFNVASLVSSLLSLVISVLYGFRMMITAEEMFSIGYLKYATLLKVQFENRQNKATQNEVLINNTTQEEKSKEEA